jgi:hypothetical protein
MKAVTHRGASPADGLLPFQFRDEFGDVVPCLKPGPCPCDDPCQRMKNMLGDPVMQRFMAMPKNMNALEAWRAAKGGQS